MLVDLYCWSLVKTVFGITWLSCQDFFSKFIMVMGYVKGTKLWEEYIDNQV